MDTVPNIIPVSNFYLDDIPGNSYSFSGYAGVLISNDDYTLINSGLLSMETTIGIFNTTLYSDQFIKPLGQLNCWLRSIISNQLARCFF